MAPIDQVVLTKSNAAPAGRLLLHRIGHALTPRLIVEDSDEDGGPPSRLYVPFTDGAGQRFFAQHVVHNEGLWIAAPRWEMLVDTSTSYSSVDMPRLGDAVISEGVPAILARWQGHDVFFSLAGANLPEPNWAESFVGFRKWQIVYWPTGQGDPVVALEWERQP